MKKKHIFMDKHHLIKSIQEKEGRCGGHEGGRGGGIVVMAHVHSKQLA